jgi:hypothetical protein
VTAAPPSGSPGSPRSLPLPGLRLPVGRRRLGAGTAASLLAHIAIITVLVVRSPALLGGGAPGPGGPLEPAGGGGGRPTLNFFVLPAAPAPAAVPVPAPPRVTLSGMPPLETIPIALPPIELPRATPPVTGSSAAGAGTATGGPGTGGAPGVGAGAGGDVGPGTGGVGGYILASPRTAILPPLAKVPGSVRGRAYHVKFWVSAEGQVTRVEVDPPIADAAYGRAFLESMMAYQFYPAHTRDGRTVPGIVTYSVQVGN